MYLFCQLIYDGTMEKWDFWSASDDIRLDPAMIWPSQNLEKPIQIALLGPPRVGNKPVRSTIFCTPSQNFDSVSASVRSYHVLINTWNKTRWEGRVAIVKVYTSVAVKASVDYVLVLGFDGSFGEDFGLNFLDIFGDGVLVGTEVFILLVRRRVLRVEWRILEWCG